MYASYVCHLEIRLEFTEGVSMLSRFLFMLSKLIYLFEGLKCETYILNPQTLLQARDTKLLKYVAIGTKRHPSDKANGERRDRKAFI